MTKNSSIEKFIGKIIHSYEENGAYFITFLDLDGIVHTGRINSEGIKHLQEQLHVTCIENFDIADKNLNNFSVTISSCYGVINVIKQIIF
ncbi:MAG: hypothetical protein PHP54_04645 [Clostridia bacterium]|nr:hypothetical protein [Clostridia bacterium]